MPSLALLAQRAVTARRNRRAARPLEIGPYSRIRLAVVQTGRTLTLEAFTGPSLHLDDLWLLFDETWVRVGTWQTTQEAPTAEPVLRHVAVLDLDVIAPEVIAPEADPDPPADESEAQGARTSVWVGVTEDRERAPRFAAEIVEGEGHLSYRVPLGRFRRTVVPPFVPVENSAGDTVVPYVNRVGHLSLAIDREAPVKLSVEVSRLRITDGRLHVAGAIGSLHTTVSAATLHLIGRDGVYRSSSAAQLRADDARTVRSYGLNHAEYTAEHDFGPDLGDLLTSDTIADLWIEATTTDGDVVWGRVRRAPYLVRQGANDGWVTKGATTLAITPYFTFKAKSPSLHLEIFATDAHQRLRRAARRRHWPLTAHRPGSKPVWLIGERPAKAQDNGLHLFRHLREHHPEIDAYYVIDERSPERKNLAGLDHVLDFKSLEHIETILRADRLVGTHHPNFLYPTRSPGFARLMKAPQVFLQHGVMGTKWMALNYGKKIDSFHTDLFLVSSEREKEYIVQDFGYRPDEVAVTGLARFDSLFDETAPVPGQILVLPTWRDWLQDTSAFTESEYFQQWRDLLTSDRLTTLLEQHGARVVFCLHPNMQQYSDHFAADGVTVVGQSDVEVQALLKQSEVLVTDYSSPGFDFSFLHKPVIYFQFDVRRFLGRWGSHLDLRNELPGPIAHDLDGTLDLLEQTLTRGRSIEPRYAARADRFVAHRDRDNSERIIAAIHGAHRTRSPWQSAVGGELPQLLLKRARKSSRYFPLMRRLFAVARLLPATDTIVFESGLGRQYSDSPRFIYEELVRRKDPRRKVWVHTKAIPVWEPHLTVVKRLSPAYFWHLGRSRYWVNNQNFPHYIRRRRSGVYLQTWHGTPLKRMLHDLDEIVGRDDGYVDRVTTAVAQWTTLLSPSPYATAAFRSAFRYDGEVLEAGYPRNDILASAEPATAVVEQVMQRLQLPEGKRVVLYAPTFRDDAKGQRGFTFELPFDLDRFAQEMDDDVVLLLRMHVLVADRLVVPDHLRGRVLDVSRYSDIQELFLVSDVLVTDYSSVFFDYALLRRPMVFHAYDLDSYRDQLRGFYLDYSSEVPGPITQTEDELYAALRSALDGPTDQSALEAFVARFAPHDDGHAAARAVDAVLDPSRPRPRA